MRIAWRICAESRSALAFSGDGAHRCSDRWNPIGVRVVYTAESRALAAMEALANVRQASLLLGVRWLSIPVQIPEDLIEKTARVPDTWRQHPHVRASQDLGAIWAREKRSPVLRVPSAVVLGEFNYLLNPLHPEFGKLKIGQPEVFTFDPRLPV